MEPLSIGGIQIQELVVSGGFSRVYRGWDRLLDRELAIKVFELLPEKESELPFPREVWLRRFVAEARLLAALDHPHLVRVHALGRLADGSPYMVMPWLVANLRREMGRDITDADEIAALDPVLRPRALSAGRAAEILRQVCLGLAPLHARGYVHRDVKPTNLLLTSRQGGVVKLCDLGLAKWPDEVAQAVARPGIWLGTPDYAAPEQMEDATQVNDRADIYSVGVLGYRLLAGRLPTEGGPSLTDAVPGLPAALADAVGAALERLPGRRPTALQLAAQLGHIAMRSAATASTET